MFDPDSIMTTEEAKRFEQSMVELEDGKTIPLSKLKDIVNHKPILPRK